MDRPSKVDDGSSTRTLRAIEYTRGQLRILNQKLLPLNSVYEDILSVQDAWTAIREMRVRGAPAIAIVAALSLCVELCTASHSTVDSLLETVLAQLAHLKTSRPTAVNLFEMADEVAGKVASIRADKAQTVQGATVRLWFIMVQACSIRRRPALLPNSRGSALAATRPVCWTCWKVCLRRM
jgi:methylthioribose-1-phosphate isomerase